MTPDQKTPEVEFRREAPRDHDILGTAPEALDDSTALAGFIEYSDDAIIAKGVTGIVTRWNHGAEKIFGYTAGEMIGTSIRRLIPTERGEEENQLLAKIRRGEIIEHFETTRLTKAGRLIHVSVAISPIKNAAGNVVGVSKVARDITRRKAEEEALRLFRTLVDQSSDTFEVIDPETSRFLDVNEHGPEELGCTRAEYLAFRVIDIDPTMSESKWRQFVETIRTAGSVTGEGCHRRKDGTTFPIEFNAKWIHLDRDYIVTTVRDITLRKRVEEALRASEEKYHGLFEGTRDAIMTLEPPSWRFTSGNPAAVTMFGAGTEEEFVALDPWNASPECQPDGRASAEKAVEMIETAMREGSHLFEWMHRRIGGVEFSADVLLTRVGEGSSTRLHATVRDITQRKQADESLKLFRALFDQSDDSFEVVNPETGRFLDVNETGAAALGWTRAEFLSLRVSDVDPTITPASWSHLAEEVRAAGSFSGEGVHQRRDGTIFPVEFHTRWVRLDRDYIVAVVRDITQRRRAEEALRESELRLRQVVENIREVFWMVDLGMQQLIYVSPGYESMWGRTCESLYESLGGWLEAIHPDDRERVERSFDANASEGTYDEEFRIVLPDGQERWVRDRGFPVKDEKGIVYRIAGVAEDITERKAFERQSLRTQRMESIGTLAGGIAHDLNNVLAPIIMSIEVLKMRFSDPESQELLEIIAKSAEHGAGMVRQVLSFARGVEGRRIEVQLRHVIQEVEKIANDTFLKSIQVRTNISSDLWLVVGDSTQFHQVLMNLCVNARDAMPNGGTLRISAENLMLDAQYVGSIPGAKAGPHVLIQVEDSGTGIAPEVMKKIFDPFFTTKEVGKGTGLGLSTTMAIIKSHGGFIQVNSEFEKGAKFSLYIPAQTESLGSAPPEVAAEMPRGHGELILVVDDDTSVRQITEKTLEKFGYRVVLASDGAEAVAMYASRHSEISAVLTDITMPILDGIAAMRVLIKMDPTVRIIGTSGLSDRGYATQAAALGVKHFLPKPFKAELLLKVLNEVITGQVSRDSSK